MVQILNRISYIVMSWDKILSAYSDTIVGLFHWLSLHVFTRLWNQCWCLWVIKMVIVIYIFNCILEGILNTLLRIIIVLKVELLFYLNSSSVIRCSHWHWLWHLLLTFLANVIGIDWFCTITLGICCNGCNSLRKRNLNFRIHLFIFSSFFFNFIFSKLYKHS